uniref:Reverse transcriptase Ty1/copia-type domain-containing protein n=1 Tax=Physcomitrium patens TaxID=3218 RepID=A0A7I4C8A2_PHYPA
MQVSKDVTLTHLSFVNSMANRNTHYLYCGPYFIILTFYVDDILIIHYILNLYTTYNFHYTSSFNYAILALLDTTKLHFYTKYIDICYHFICQFANVNKLCFNYCPINKIQANIFTKPFSSPKLATHLPFLGVL